MIELPAWCKRRCKSRSSVPHAAAQSPVIVFEIVVKGVVLIAADLEVVEFRVLIEYPFAINALLCNAQQQGPVVVDVPQSGQANTRVGDFVEIVLGSGGVVCLQEIDRGHVGITLESAGLKASAISGRDAAGDVVDIAALVINIHNGAHGHVVCYGYINHAFGRFGWGLLPEYRLRPFSICPRRRWGRAYW